uniref:Uncharacterized protein n=1 Tax=Timema genevievae TaxID=629358 RepID=A0A7R9JVA4_TIMGE|nr:unnamed protein product [Timema genevievae]
MDFHQICPVASTIYGFRDPSVLVGAEGYFVSRKYHPPIMRHHKLATGLASLQLLMGIAITTLAVWLLLWAPHLRARDIPYWSGVPGFCWGIQGVDECHVVFSGRSRVPVSAM